MDICLYINGGMYMFVDVVISCMLTFASTYSAVEVVLVLLVCYSYRSLVLLLFPHIFEKQNLIC